MKYLIFILFCPILALGQMKIESSSLVMGFAKSDSYLHTSINDCFGDYKVSVISNTGFYVCGAERCRSGTEIYDYYKIFYLSQVYYIDRTNLNLDGNIFNQILSFENDKRDAFFKTAEAKENVHYNKIVGNEFGVWGNVKSNSPTYLFSNYNGDNCTADYSNPLKEYNDKFFVIGDTACNKKSAKSYIVLAKNRRYMIERFYFTNSGDIDKTLVFAKKSNPDINVREKLAGVFVKQKAVEEVKEIKYIRSQLDSIYKIYRDRNLVLRRWSWSYANENSYFTDIDIKVLNPYKKKIKYLWFTFKATNPVGDPARDMSTGKSEKTVQGIGPIEYGDDGTYNFESVFYSKVVHSIRLTQIKIQFFDGSVKTIVNPLSFNSDE